MRSIKPGRGPSMMGGISSIFAALFGVLWTVIAWSGGAGFFALFGVIFIVMALVQAWYNFHNATTNDRFSTFDIVDSHEEMDPLDPRSASRDSQDDSPVRVSGSSEAPRFCPYCGTPLQENYSFCPECGKKLR